MSASIVRISGDLIKTPATLKNLKPFLAQQSEPKILVVSVFPEISKLIERAIEQVFNHDNRSENLPEQLDEIKTMYAVEDENGAYGAESEKLANLLKGIYLTGDYSEALKDQVVSQGEILSAWLLSSLLQKNGIDTQVVTPEEVELRASPDFGNATFISVNAAYFQSLTTSAVAIIPGSYGITQNGKISRAGVSAADYTAAFIAAELNAKRLILWGARKAFYTVNPELVASAGIINRLTYSEASELAYFEHFSLHPRAVEPLVKKHIPIHLIQPDSGKFIPDTVINTENYVAENIVKSVAYTDDISILRLNGPGVGLKPGILARITGKLAELSINIKSVITSQVSINILLDGKSGKKASLAARELGFTAVNEIELLQDVSLIAIVGHGMQHNSGISAKLFGAVAQNRINVILSGSGASDLVSYLLVESNDRNKSVKAIYEAFFKN